MAELSPAQSAALLAAAAASALVGFGWLALAMDVHWAQVHGGAEGPGSRARRVLRLLGALAIATSAAICAAADRPSMAALVSVMLLSVSAAAIAFTLSRRPSLLRLLWPAGRLRADPARRSGRPD